MGRARTHKRSHSWRYDGPGLSLTRPHEFQTAGKKGVLEHNHSERIPSAGKGSTEQLGHIIYKRTASLNFYQVNAAYDRV